MGIHYKHLSEKDRVFLRIMLDKHYSKTKIAKILGVSPSTIYREVKRNSCTHWHSGLKFYWNHHAQQKYVKRRKRGLKLEKDANLQQYVHKKIKAGWSPYQIEGRLKTENDGVCQISHESIYQYIYSDFDRRNRFYKYLRRRHNYRLKRNQRKSRIPSELLITSRPESIKHREEFGHWECDLMVFKKGVKTNLITLRERQTRYMIAIKNENREASGTALALINTIKKIKPYIKSITFDQGSEFKRYEWIKECLEADIYFCEAGSPYQKGSVENGNGTIRVELPRTYPIEDLKQKSVTALIKNINNRPLKCLNYKTPTELFNQLTENKLYET